MRAIDQSRAYELLKHEADTHELPATKEAYEYWLMRYNKAKDYDGPHWDAEERAAHHRWLEAMRRIWSDDNEVSK
jgi:hypothetical protein